MLWYDRDGKTYDLDEYVRLGYMEMEYRRVADTRVGTKRISTVLLGFDHGYGGKLHIFETMVFPEDSYCERYATLAEAQTGHDRIVANVQEDRDPYMAQVVDQLLEQLP